jgi:hypothetical protein
MFFLQREVILKDLQVKHFLFKFACTVMIRITHIQTPDTFAILTN